MMTMQSYLEQRQRLRDAQKQYRESCLVCMRPGDHCYCGTIHSFDPNIKFVILIHHLEDRRPIATGRMSHLLLKNSELILGQDYSHHKRIDNLINDKNYYPVILYPGFASRNLSQMSLEQRADLFPTDKKLMIFVIDGTWNTANKMVRSQNLFDLPRVCFTPQEPSKFRVRKQPKAECYSTLEAIHQTIELVGSGQGFDLHSRLHDNLLNSFEWMVNKQFAYLARALPRHTRRVG
jgi:DTW domain-containing protein YfiP